MNERMPEIKNPVFINDGGKFLRETGLLFKINREILHPFGLAMQINLEHNGDESISNTLWDCREDAEGILYAQDTFSEGVNKLNAFYAEFGNTKLFERLNTLGFIIQGIPEAIEKDIVLEWSFSDALVWLKAGKKIARRNWNGKGMFVVMMPALSLPPYSSQEPGPKVNDRTAKHIGEDTPLESQPYIAMFTADQKWQPGWVPSQADMFANDWILI